MELIGKEEKRGVGTVTRVSDISDDNIALYVGADRGHLFVIEKSRFPILESLKNGDNVVVTWVTTTIARNKVTNVEKSP